MQSLPQASYQHTNLPTALTVASAVGSTVPSAESQAMGRVPYYGGFAVEVDQACVITAYIWCVVSQKWRIMTINKAVSTFTAAGIDWYLAPLGAKIYLECDTATAKIWTDLDSAA